MKLALKILLIGIFGQVYGQSEICRNFQGMFLKNVPSDPAKYLIVQNYNTLPAIMESCPHNHMFNVSSCTCSPVDVTKNWQMLRFWPAPQRIVSRTTTAAPISNIPKFESDVGREQFCAYRAYSGEEWSAAPINFNVTSDILDALNQPSANRIAHGDEVKEGETPWTVRVLTCKGPCEDSSFSTCGGTLINAEWVLTTASCIFLNEPGNKLDIELQFGREYDAEFSMKALLAVRHCQYVSNADATDGIINRSNIALIRINGSIDFSTSSADVKAASLPTHDFCTQITSKCTDIVVAGRGTVDDDVLTKMSSQKIIDNALCERERSVQLASEHFCTRDESNQAVCRDDHGSAAICLQTSVPFVIGVATQDEDPCDPPSIFTNACFALNWIKAAIYRFKDETTS